MTAVETSPAGPAGRPLDAHEGDGWMRLDQRMIWVDLAQSLLSLSPTAIAVWVAGVEVSWSSLWPLVMIGAFGVLGALRNATRWLFTRYRVTDDHVERRTGVLVRRYRSVRRDRIRSVDTTARLRHRLAGLRVVLVGAGQQTAAGESALTLDALNRADAAALRRTLLMGHLPSPSGAVTDENETRGGTRDDGHVLARFRAWWVVYNVFGIWAYVTAAGLLWGAYWVATTFGLDPAAWAERLLDPERLGWPRTVGLALLLTGALGAVGMAANYFTAHWRFELARVPGDKATQLRTRQGLFTTREVNRDDRRLRGVVVSEPVLWRWAGMADTQVITTGLSVWSASQPATILPRGPLRVARRVAGAVLDAEPDPFAVPLRRHPGGALRRRLWWATAFAGVVTGGLWWLATNGAIATAVLWWGAALWAVALLAAVVAYRALGHAITGRYLVVRSGLAARATTVLRRDAVSTVALRESVLQRRLGLRTVSAMTAAGWGVYEAPDVAADDALAFAVDAAPGLLAPFVVHDHPTPGLTAAEGGTPRATG